jgi:hypothetical protein
MHSGKTFPAQRDNFLENITSHNILWDPCYLKMSSFPSIPSPFAHVQKNILENRKKKLSYYILYIDVIARAGVGKTIALLF